MREAFTGRRSAERAEQEPKEDPLGALNAEKAPPTATAVSTPAKAPAGAAEKPAGSWKPEKPLLDDAPKASDTAVRRPNRTKPTPFMRQKIRDRYLAARFPGSRRTDADLANTDEVIKAARLFFEDGDADRACEWLAFASDANPDEGLWLAQLEILFLKRNGEVYTELAGEYRERFPESTHWGDVARMGARIVKGEALFAGAEQPEGSGDDHYGLWPQMQNWIRAPFDLTEAESELVAGFQTEYSSMAFALFRLGEYGNVILMCRMNALPFCGGWFPAFDDN